MTLLRKEPARHSIAKHAGLATLRALRSMIVIVVVILVVVAIRDGGFTWSNVPRVVGLNRSLLIMTFLGLWIWEYWFLRTKGDRVGQNGND